ncbi:MAG: DUF1559 domain-containing protein [Pirellulaceae bacterium]|nr:DUF1559 domain-containing protein [Planctomycetales bacterium]
MDTKTRATLSRTRPRAFTLVELLVVIAIIGLLVALLLPAVNAAREAARKIQCTNNLKNISLAMHNYHSARNVFPPAIVVRSGAASDGDKGQFQQGRRLFANWAILLLPYIEEQSLYDSFTLNADGGVQISDPINSGPRGTELAVMLCPSDQGLGSRMSLSLGNWARGNYGINGGQYLPILWDREGVGDDPFAQGIAPLGEGINIKKITDGTTKTLMFGELRVGLGDRDRRGVWAMGMVGSSIHWRHASNQVNAPNSCQRGDDDVKDSQFIIQDVDEQTLLSNCMYPDAGYSEGAQSVVRSVHPGGVNVAMCDGSVRFISDFVEAGSQGAGVNPDPKVFRTWQRLNVATDSYVIEGQW